MNRLQTSGGKCLFLGSSESVLQKIKQRALQEFVNVKVETYSPPYKPIFSAKDNDEMIKTVDQMNPDVLFVGMTAPKQEKWAYEHVELLKYDHICALEPFLTFILELLIVHRNG